MRKKSHISLAKYIVNNLEEQELMKHKKAFYLGSILPDCKPSFLTTKHEIDSTFTKVKEDIMKLTDGNNLPNIRVFSRNLGQVLHYIADYFTFPHNIHYPGTIKDHCVYEEKLKKSLKNYINSGEASKNIEEVMKLETTEDIFEFIQHAHEVYMSIKTNVEEDCIVIVSLCHQVAEAITKLFFIQSRNLTAIFC